MKTIRKSSIADVPPQRIFIGVAGGSAAGKTTLCETINRQMAFDRNFKVEMISMDSFYKSINKDQVDVSEYNFDHPLALDFDAAYKVLNDLKTSNQPVQIPKYSFVTHQRLQQTDFVNPANIILFQGLMAFHDERIRNLMTYKIFINCDDDIRLCRRLKRDTTERQRTVQSVLKQYNKFVKNAFRDFIYPTISYADLIIPGSRNNRISVDFIVQHIKNMAKKINLFEKAYKTKVFLFGENEYFDKNIKNSYETSISLQKQSFLVFPTSEEHRKQLQFFMNYLMSESFSQEYFKEIYVYQFMKIGRSLLRQLIDLKGLKTEDMQIFSIYDCGQKIQKRRKNIKIIFAPFLFENNGKFASQLKKKILPNQTIIILNFFCDMRFPNIIYQAEIDGLIFINLFLVPNKNRLLEILNSNNINLSKDKDNSWFISNQQIIKTSLNFVSRQLKIMYDNDIQKQYEEAVELCRKQKTCPHTYQLSQRQKYKNIQQIPVYRQQHQNLCGFHALNNIKQSQGQVMRKINLIETFEKVQNILKSYIGYPQLINIKKFEPLQRGDIHKLLEDPMFESKQICPFYISESCITNSLQQRNNLVFSISKLKEGFIDKLHVIVGCYNHYFVLCLKNNTIYYFDSLNTPLVQVMEGKVSVPNAKPQDHQRIKDMKSAITVLNNLYLTEGSIEAQIIKLGIDNITGSYFKLKDEEEKKKWFIDEYPPQVLRNDFICFLKEEFLNEIDANYLQRLQKWLCDKVIVQQIGNANQLLQMVKKIKK